MLNKKTVVEYDIHTDSGSHYRIGYLPDSKVIFINEVDFDGNLGEDLVSFNVFDLDIFIEALKDIRGY